MDPQTATPTPNTAPQAAAQSTAPETPAPTSSPASTAPAANPDSKKSMWMWAGGVVVLVVLLAVAYFVFV